MPMTAIILAAGEGTRMKSRHPKVMHKLLDRPLVSWVTRAARAAGAERIVVVVGNGAQEVRDHLANEKNVECVEQAERLGTGHAVTRRARGLTGIDARARSSCSTATCRSSTADTVRASSRETVAHRRATPATVMTMTPPDPFGYGRIKLGADGTDRAHHRAEGLHAPSRPRTLLECNAGCYAFDGAQLAAHISEIGNDNAQAEYYLPDMLEILQEPRPRRLHRPLR